MSHDIGGGGMVNATLDEVLVCPEALDPIHEEVGTFLDFC